MAEFTAAIVDDSDEGHEVTINFTAVLQKETFTPRWNVGTASNLAMPRTRLLARNNRKLMRVTTA